MFCSKHVDSSISCPPLNTVIYLFVLFMCFFMQLCSCVWMSEMCHLGPPLWLTSGCQLKIKHYSPRCEIILFCDYSELTFRATALDYSELSNTKQKHSLSGKVHPRQILQHRQGVPKRDPRRHPLGGVPPNRRRSHRLQLDAGRPDRSLAPVLQ